MKSIVNTIPAAKPLLRLALLVSLSYSSAFATDSFGPTGVEGTVSKATVKVVAIQQGSPADGKLKKGDIIVGVGTSSFGKNPKRDVAAAIDAAETEGAGGKMTLRLKNDKTVVIVLPVLGTYSSTAPYECAKTDRIVTQTAEALLKTGKADSSPTRAGLLGLLATGERKYIDAVTKFIKEDPTWSKLDGNPIPPAHYCTWRWGYSLITLSEYHLLTNDDSVLPAIRSYALSLAAGQDAGGLWGHTMINTESGRLRGYAQMNQPSLSCFMGMLLARKCGVKDQLLDRAIEVSYAYFASHVGKGTFPYGVHGPNSRAFDNNGMSGSAALCMAFYGNRDGAKFFSQLSATSYDNLEQGHGSNFFNPLWTPAGANLSGPEVTQQFFKRSLWYFNLRRHWDGSFANAGKPGPLAGPALLTYCLPRKTLLITGRQADQSIWAKGQAATDVILTSKIDYKSKSVRELVQLSARHSLPQVRRQASAALGDHREQLTPYWVKYLKEGTTEQKLLANSQYGWWIPIDVRLPQVDNIGAILCNSEESLDVRVAASGTLAYMGEPAQKYYMNIVDLLALDKPDDSLGMMDMALGKNLNALCANPLAAELISDKAKFYKAALKLIRHKRQHARADGMRMLAGMPLEDFHIVANDILHVIEDKDPTYHSYHNPSGPVVAAIEILANLNIREGLDFAMAIENNPSGKASFKFQATWAVLKQYGGNAKAALKDYQVRHDNRTDWGKFSGKYKAMVEAIEGDHSPQRLITLKQAIQVGRTTKE